MDFEDILDAIRDLYQDNLFAKLNEITAEKDDDITLSEIVDDAYMFQTLDGQSVNYNPFLYYGIADIQGSGHYPNTVTKLFVNVAVVLEDRGEDANITRRMLRYQRALREVAEENFDLVNGAKMSVQSQVPIEIKLINSSFSHKAIGVTLTIDLG